MQTSLWEGFGYVLAEALACGTTVVAFDCKGAMKEILDNGKFGKLVPCADLVSASDAILDSILNPFNKSSLDSGVK